MACANLKGARCVFDLFLQKSSDSFSNYSAQDLNNANRSYSRVFVQGDESAGGVDLQQRWLVSDLSQIFCENGSNLLSQNLALSLEILRAKDSSI